MTGVRDAPTSQLKAVVRSYGRARGNDPTLAEVRRQAIEELERRGEECPE